MAKLVIRGSILTFTDDPFQRPAEECMLYEPDGAMVIRNGLIESFGPAPEILAAIRPDTPVVQYRHSLILPGFIDCHTHYPQSQIIASHGKKLLGWLNKYTFVAEQEFRDKAYAGKVARFFLKECLRAGTTTAGVFCTVHPESVDAFFEESEKYNMRNLAGKVLMDRNAPEVLTDTPQVGYDQTKALIQKWHGRGRQLYAISPRFASTSSPEQMEMTGAVWREHPGVYLQSHISENHQEVAWVKELYPERKGYVDIYDHYGQLGPRAIFGHGVYLTEEELGRLHETGTAIAHCPTSNLFLGSGLFNLERAVNREHPVRVGLATDIGAGTSFSMLQTMNEAYKVAQLSGFPLSAPQAFYLATRGAAMALYLEDKIGSIAPGMEADLVVLDLHSTPIIDFRMQYARDIMEVLFIQMTLGDDRAIRATYVAGELLYEREDSAS